MYKEYLNKTVKVVVDRPLGSKHPRYNFIYPINYGYIPDTKAEDGEEIDAYVLGESNALSEYEGTVIAVVNRKNDDEDKLVVANQDYSVAEIKSLIHFQEQFFEIELIKMNLNIP